MAGSKIVIVMASPREKGNCAVLANAVAEGAEAVGARVEAFFLHGMEINPCDACDMCHGEPYNGCIIEDDMQLLYPRLLAADAIVIASPVYWFTMSAQAKLFLDRCYALVDAEGHLLRGKKIGIVMTYGDTDPFSSGAVNAFRTFQDAFDYVGSKIVGMVYGHADGPGAIAKNKDVVAGAYELGEQLGSGG